MRRVAITGFGAITPVGNTAATTWQALVEGRSGIGRITIFSPEEHPTHIAGQVKDFDIAQYLPNPRLKQYLSRSATFGVAAFLQALDAAQVTAETYAPHERGLAIGCGVLLPDIQDIADWLLLIHNSEGHSYPKAAPGKILRHSHNTGAAIMAHISNSQGPVISNNMACASSSNAIGEAFRRIQDGEVKLMAAGGYDSMVNMIDVVGFSILQALTPFYNDQPEKASRPFDRERSGFVLGEGAVVVILEDLESALERGAQIYAELVGYGSSLNAYRLTDSPPDGDGAIQAMHSALRESGLRTDEIDYIAAHGTSTPGNDISETTAIKRVFGDNAYRLAISSPKSMTGHLTAASGALNLLAAVYAIREQIIPPTINYEHPDPKLDLDYVPNTARSQPVRAAMANAFAFGGTNAVLVVQAHPPLSLQSDPSNSMALKE